MTEGIDGTWEKREVPTEGIGALCTYFAADVRHGGETLRAEKESLLHELWHPRAEEEHE